MPNFTSNFGLTKPFVDEFYDVNVQNENMEKIDRELANKECFVVNIRLEQGFDTYYADKTYSEIITAENNGKTIVGYLHHDNDLDNVVDGVQILTNYERLNDNIRLTAIDKNMQVVIATITNYGVGVMWNQLYNYGTTDLTAGTSALETGKLYLVYE